MVLTYVVLLLISAYLLIKWTAYRKYKRTMIHSEQLDQLLINGLNEKGDPDAK